MSDALTTGSTRLGEELSDQIDEDASSDFVLTQDWFRDFIKADPGVKALMELETYRKFIALKDGTTIEYVPMSAVRAALKLWEHGEEVQDE